MTQFGHPCTVYFDVLLFSFAGDYRYFSIDAVTGVVTVSSEIDRENPEVLAKLGVLDSVVQVCIQQTAIPAQYHRKQIQ